jgi:Transglutaminase-like superfamily
MLTPFFWNFRALVSLPDRTRSRLRTGLAGLYLIAARLMVALVPLRFWRTALGCQTGTVDLPVAKRLAAHVERAATLLPVETKCLPRAMALSRMLRSRRILHAVVIAARPASDRGGDTDLHAWVECGDVCILGELPGPWCPVLRQPPLRGP